MKKLMCLVVFLATCVFCSWGAKVETEKTITVNGVTRKYLLYVPDNVGNNPAMVFSLHGASGHSADRSHSRQLLRMKKDVLWYIPKDWNNIFQCLAVV